MRNPPEEAIEPDRSRGELVGVTMEEGDAASFLLPLALLEEKVGERATAPSCSGDDS